MKRIISALLAVVLATVMTVAAFAANPKITEQTSSLGDVDAGDCTPGDKIFIPLVKDAFDGAEEDLTMSDVKASKITVKQTAKSGSKAIASAEIKEDSGKVASVLITLTDPFTSTKPLEFETKVELYINGKRQPYSTVVTGTLSNSYEEVYSDTDYVDLSSGRTASCVESAKKVETYIGGGVSIFVNMVKGKEYYGAVSGDPDDDDYIVFDQYPDVADVLALTTIGMNAEGKNVKLDVDRDYYVYSKNLDYLGRSSEMIPYSTKYYLATKKLDIAEEPGDEPSGESEPEEIPSIEEPEDDTEAPGVEDDISASGTTANASGNPDTGIPALFYIAVVSSVLSLGTSILLSTRRKQ